MNKMNKLQIRERLERQFKVLEIALAEGTIGPEDVKNILLSEEDICDKLDPMSSEYEYARDMQYNFLISEC